MKHVNLQIENPIIKSAASFVIERERLSKKWFSSDVTFNQVYPLSIQLLADKHWTKLEVSEMASNFLAAEKNVSILDIGSGVGKFCLSAAYFKPEAFYYGVEQRRNLICHAEKAKSTLHFKNVSFINSNFTQIDFKKYDHFYFYNSFYENIAGTTRIDDSIAYSSELFNYYNHYLFSQLNKKPSGTRLATFHSLEDEIPPAFHVVGSAMNNLLKFWIKV
ncbi:MAG: methyltransferase domain-containing protein [Ferruginibacter sp.]